MTQFVERYTGARRVTYSWLSPVTVLCPWAWPLICCLVIVQSKRAGNHPNMTNIVDEDVNHQQKQTKQMYVNQSIC